MKNKALLVIDVQNGMFLEGEEVFNGNRLLQGIKDLIKQVRSAKMPVLFIQHNEAAGYPLENGTYGWEIHSEIIPEDGDIIIQKTTPDSFLKTTLDQELKEKGIEHLYLVGIQTEVCVDTTCRSAFSKGYKVTLVSDLHSTWPGNELTAQQIINHHNGTLRWFADVQSSDEINISKLFS
jgi:nicotinamidase-related amidase